MDVQTPTNNSIVRRNINDASYNWGCIYRKQVGYIDDKFVYSNVLFVLYDDEDTETFIRFAESSMNLDLAMVSANIVAPMWNVGVRGPW